MKNYILEKKINDFLNIDLFSDYAPNGLQIEGRENIQKIVTGVTASQELIDKAVELKADALLVHHGYFWKGDSSTITGIKYKRISKLIKNDINLLAYHLPLDANDKLGNNIMLAAKLRLKPIRKFADNIALLCENKSKLTTMNLICANIKTQLNRRPTFIKASCNTIKKIAICTGSGQDFIEEAYKQGADLFISGEISEKTTHLAKELNISYISAGHHATECDGIKALGEYLADKYKLEHTFVNIYNPA